MRAWLRCPDQIVVTGMFRSRFVSKMETKRDQILLRDGSRPEPASCRRREQRDRGRMSNRDASSWQRRGRFLNKFATIAQAAVARTLSAGQIGELEHLHQPKFDNLLGEHQQLLVEQLAALDVAGTKTLCALWRQRAQAIIDDTEPADDPPRSLTMTRAGDGALLGRFTLDDDAATELEKAIRNTSSDHGAGEERSVQQRNADGLFDIAAFYNKDHQGNGTPRHLPHLGISVDASPR